VSSLKVCVKELSLKRVEHCWKIIIKKLHTVGELLVHNYHQVIVVGVKYLCWEIFGKKGKSQIVARPRTARKLTAKS
jgi:hypothetical protein